MASTVTDVVSRALTLANDPNGVRWTSTESLLWVNDGLVELVIRKPSAYTQHAPFTCAAGPKQTITGVTGALAVVDIPYTLDSDIPDSAVRKAALADIAAIDPLWATKEGDTVKHWMPDADPRTFYVYPANEKTTTRVVELVYAAIPSKVSSTGAALPVHDVYVPALANYLLYRYYSKDAENATNASLAAAYYTQFTNTIGG